MLSKLTFGIWIMVLSAISSFGAIITFFNNGLPETSPIWWFWASATVALLIIGIRFTILGLKPNKEN